MILTANEFRNIPESLNKFVNYIIDTNDAIVFSEFRLDYSNFNKIYDFIDLYFDRQNYIIKLLNKYFEENDSINADGLIVFGLSEYNILLKKAINKSIEKISEAKKYSIFISKIKDILSETNCMTDVINIIFLKGNYIIFDNDMKPLNLICKNILDKEFNYDFSYNEVFLISAVLSLSPKRIIMHGQLYNEIHPVEKLLRDIYGENYVKCDGCFLCEI